MTIAILFRRCCAITLVLLCLAAVGSADDATQPIWLVSTRCSPGCGDLSEAFSTLGYWRWSESDGWSSFQAKDFQAADSTGVPTVVFIHGNDTNDDEAVVKGCTVRESIRSEVGERAFRFVIWSWPADRILRRHRRDIQLKAARCDAESYYLASWLNNLHPGVKVGLVGHSFGPRVILGAMHLLAGGDVAGQTMPAETVSAWTEKTRNPIRALLLAAAEDAYSLAPDGQHGRAISLLDETLITCNCCDRVLRLYPRLYGRGGPQALGAVGPCGLDEAAAKKIRLLDVAQMIGKAHDYQCYCSAISACGQWARYTFLEEERRPDDR
jgi:hypothetical protein